MVKRGENRSFFLSHLGCAKNKVDGEIIITLLEKEGWVMKEDPKDCNVIIINTCGFIKDAKEESIEAILEACGHKERNPKIKVVVAGCLGQRYARELAEEIPEIDSIIGLNRIKDITSILKDKGECKIYPDVGMAGFNDDLVMRSSITNRPYAYLRISEGCSNYCSYCAIPKIRGEFRSRPVDSIMNEATSFIKRGIKELILISQDTTRYGYDLKRGHDLPSLLHRLCEIEGDFWIRLLYCHPAHFPPNIIDVIKEEEKVLNYIDMPIQHCNKRILSSMGRDYTKDDIKRLVDRMRKCLEGIVLRTTLIVGFPGESDEEFEELLEFVEEVEFNHLGAFAYSPEEGTRAYDMPGHIPEEVKEERLERLMLLQAGISAKRNAGFVGHKFKTLFERSPKHEDDGYIGRCYAHAPEVDGNIFLNDAPAKIDTSGFFEVKITRADVYDLYGDIII